MTKETFDDDEEVAAVEEPTEETDASSTDEGFMKGYLDEKEAVECAECGTAIVEHKKVTKEFEGESYVFCSKDCAEDYEDEMGSSEEN